MWNRQLNGVDSKWMAQVTDSPMTSATTLNTLRSRQDGRHFADDIFKCIFLNKNVWIPIKISMKFVPKGPINNIPTMVQIMAWRRPGNKPLSEPMVVCLPTHICVAWPQWVKIDVQSFTHLLYHAIKHSLRLTINPIHWPVTPQNTIK